MKVFTFEDWKDGETTAGEDQDCKRSLLGFGRADVKQAVVHQVESSGARSG